MAHYSEQAQDVFGLSIAQYLFSPTSEKHGLTILSFSHLKRGSDQKLCHVCEALKETVQMLAPLGGRLAAFYVHTRLPVGMQQWNRVQAVAGPLQVSHRNQCLLDSKQVLLAHWNCKLSHLHHGIEGAATVTATHWWHLCSWGAPTLGRVWGHKQGTAAVSRVFQVCQGGPCSGQRLLQVPRQCTFSVTIPWGQWASLHGLKGIIVCRKQRKVRPWQGGHGKAEQTRDNPA